MLYGATPFAGRPAASLALRPAMMLESRLIGEQQLAAGDAVGYGGAFVANAPMRVGVVACGYADGYPRHAPTGTPVTVAGVRTRTLGRVSMDMLCVDLEPVPQARVGDSVQLWGDQIPIDEVAAHAGTIGYELMCAVAPRVARFIED
jgi:alanine racemase